MYLCAHNLDGADATTFRVSLSAWFAVFGQIDNSGRLVNFQNDLNTGIDGTLLNIANGIRAGCD